MGDIPLLIVPLPTYHYFVDKLDPVYDPLFESLTDVGAGLHVYGLTADLVKGKGLTERQKMCSEHDRHYSPYGHREIAKLLAAEIHKAKALAVSN